MGSITAYEIEAGRRYRVRWRNDQQKQVEKKGFRTKKDAHPARNLQLAAFGHAFRPICPKGCRRSGFRSPRPRRTKAPKSA